jgi:hypothetical protein
MTVHTVSGIGDLICASPLTVVFMIGSAAIYKRYRDSVKGADAKGRVSLIAIVRRDGLYYYLGVLGGFHSHLFNCSERLMD